MSSPLLTSDKSSICYDRGLLLISNLRVLILIDCLFLFLSSFLKPQIPGVLKHP